MGFMHPEVLVIGEEYPLTPTRAMLSKVVSFAQTGLMVIGIGGSFIPMIRDHPLYQRFQDKKMFIFLGGYFVLNWVQGQVSTTGAFEISVNNQLIFSKLRQNRMPSVEEITSQIRA
jgi:thioredoxin reductase-like selenoprotein T